MSGYKNISELNEDLNKIDEKIRNIDLYNGVNDLAVEKINEELSVVNEKIRSTNMANKLRPIIKNIKVFGRLIQGVAPYVIVAGLIFGAQSILFDEVPFVRQNQIKTAHHEQIIDNTGIISDSITYDVKPMCPPNYLEYRTNWQKKDDGKYYQTTKKYYGINDYIDEIRELLKDPNANYDELLGRASNIEHKIKTEDEIAKEDLEEENRVELVYHYIDDTDIKLSIQDEDDNSLFSSVYLVVTFLACIPVFSWRMFESKYSFSDYLEEYKELYKKVDIKELKRLFDEEKIKVEKINRQRPSFDTPIVYLKNRTI